MAKYSLNLHVRRQKFTNMRILCIAINDIFENEEMIIAAKAIYAIA